MTKKRLQTLLVQVKGDNSLKKILKDASNLHEVATIAKGEGSLISTDNFNNTQSELSEPDLRSLGCGNYCWTIMLIGLRSAVSFNTCSN